jgi:hypothetical protein
MAQKVYFIEDRYVLYGLRQIGYGLGFNTRTPTTDSADSDLYIEPECAPGLGNFKSMDWEQGDIKLILKFGTWSQGVEYAAYLWRPEDPEFLDQQGNITPIDEAIKVSVNKKLLILNVFFHFLLKFIDRIVGYSQH